MKSLKINRVLIVFFALSFLWSCKEDTQWKGQDPIEKVDTHTKSIQYQVKKTYDLGQGIYCSNEFEGARLNEVLRTNDTLLTVFISPENKPINPSPWYAFKIWSETKQSIYLKLTYPENVKHRYYPKLSSNGLNWNILDSVNYFPDNASRVDGGSPRIITMKLSISPDTLWVAAQELLTSIHNNMWMDTLVKYEYVDKFKIGESHEKRPINMLKIGNSNDKKMIVVLSRQHPPEVTGYLAMKSFVETIASDSEIAKDFREEYNTYVFPFINPDGVDNGHWRHNAGGVDLNRDWATFNQPEVSSIYHFMKKKVEDTKGKFYFGVDFHSTFQDIYYTMNPELKGNMPGLVPDMINAMAAKLSGYEPNIRPGSLDETGITSKGYLFFEFGAESVTFEIGDNTPRDFIKQKGEVAANTLMELLLK